MSACRLPTPRASITLRLCVQRKKVQEQLLITGSSRRSRRRRSSSSSLHYSSAACPCLCVRVRLSSRMRVQRTKV